MDGFLRKEIIKITSRKGRNVIEYIHRRNLKGSPLRRNRTLLSYLRSPEIRW